MLKLLKARYFPSCSFAEARLGRYSSYVWRSIFAAKDLILSGSVMKVGRGDSINVWTDPWISCFSKMIVKYSCLSRIRGSKSLQFTKGGRQ